MSQRFILNVNGKTHAVDADSDMPLLYALRNDVGLNNPHFGCGLAQCGACMVHLDGEPIDANERNVFERRYSGHRTAVVERRWIGGACPHRRRDELRALGTVSLLT